MDWFILKKVETTLWLIFQKQENEQLNMLGSSNYLLNQTK